MKHHSYNRVRVCSLLSSRLCSQRETAVINVRLVHSRACCTQRHQRWSRGVLACWAAGWRFSGVRANWSSLHAQGERHVSIVKAT